MHAARFEHVLRVVTAAHSRRELTRTLLGLSLGSATAVTAWNQAPGKKKSCPPCKKLKKGKCKRKRPDGTACGPCRTCQSGRCSGVAPTNAACNGDGKCFAGECAARPTCSANAATCSAVTPCCGTCNDAVDLCRLSDAGEECYETANCAVGIGLTCQGYRCR